MTVKDRVALVTGGSRGIGRAIVESLARTGAKVAFVYNSNSAAAEEVVSALAAEGHEAWAIQADVRSKPAADQVVADVVAKWGKLEILVNNAGIIRDTLLAKMDSTQWQDVIDTNLTSVFNFCQAATMQMMSQRYGRIINMSSVAADVSNPGQANYAASKGGVEGFTRCVATELARRGVTANAVAPGFIETDMTAALNEKLKEEHMKAIPLGRYGHSNEVAELVAFLASDAAAYITGQVIGINGGMYM